MRRLSRLALLFVAFGTAAGCEDAGGADQPPLERAAIAGGDVTVAGPDGYCIDRRTLRDEPASSFALLAPCAHTGEAGAEGGAAVDAVLMTVTVGPAAADTDLPTPEALAELAAARLISGGMEDGFVLVHLEGGGEDAIPDGDPRHWRAAFVQAGHLVGLALYAPAGSAAAGDVGADLLTELRDRVRTLSGEPGA